MRSDARKRAQEKADIAALVERSSLGTPEAQALRASVSDEDAARVVARAEELRTAEPDADERDLQREAEDRHGPWDKESQRYEDGCKEDRPHRDPDADERCECPPCPGRGNDGHGMTHCAECCFGQGVEADELCPAHGRLSRTPAAHLAAAKAEPDQRWDTAVDWLLNHRDVVHDAGVLFWAFYDGVITERELRDEAVAETDAEGLPISIWGSVRARAARLREQGGE